MGDAFTVEVVEPFEELVSHLLYCFEPGCLLYVSTSWRLLSFGHDTLPRVDVIFGEVAWHEVTDEIQILAVPLSKNMEN